MSSNDAAGGAPRRGSQYRVLVAHFVYRFDTGSST